MKRSLFILLLAAVFVFTSQAQEFEVVPVQESGEIDQRINLVFLGDGYLEEDLDDYIIDVTRILRELFLTPPFQEYQQYFNVYAIKVPSNERGASRDPDNLIDNYFGSTYFFADIERLLVPTKNDVIMDVLADNFPDYDQVFVLVNDDKYGGSGGWVATSSTNIQAGEIAIHEIGHSLVGLADEYWAGPQFARETDNMTQETSNRLVKWKNWIGFQGVGIHSHDADASWKKPHQNCKMEFLGVPFCAVCKEAFIKTFYDITPSIDSVEPAEASDTNAQDVFRAFTKTPNPFSLSTFWLLDGDTVARDIPAYQVDASSLSDGSHELSFHSVDLTELSRKDRFFMDIARWSLVANNGTATYTYDFARQSIERIIFLGGEVTGIDDEFIRSIDLKTAPNPVSDRLKITFNNPAPGPFSMQLIDLNGKVFQSEDRELLEQGKQEFLIDTSGLDHGVFLVQMAIGNKLVVKKVLK